MPAPDELVIKWATCWNLRWHLGTHRGVNYVYETFAYLRRSNCRAICCPTRWLLSNKWYKHRLARDVKRDIRGLNVSSEMYFNEFLSNVSADRSRRIEIYELAVVNSCDARRLIQPGQSFFNLLYAVVPLSAMLLPAVVLRLFFQSTATLFADGEERERRKRERRCTLRHCLSPLCQRADKSYYHHRYPIFVKTDF